MARADPVSEERASLYEPDFYLGLERQAELLRDGRLSELDLPNLLEEIDDMGRSEKRCHREQFCRLADTSAQVLCTAGPALERLAGVHRPASPSPAKVIE